MKKKMKKNSILEIDDFVSMDFFLIFNFFLEIMAICASGLILITHTHTHTHTLPTSKCFTNLCIQ
jgi:hypothetical protein